MVDPYPDPDEIRARVSSGGPELNPNVHDDAWITRQTNLWANKLERHTGDCYIERDRTWAGTVPGCTRSLVLPDVNVTEITSVTVDGDTITVDSDQPSYAAGIVVYTSGFQTGQAIVVTYKCGGTQDDLILETVGETTVLWVERKAALDRSSNTRDASRIGFDGGSSTVFVMPDPDATPPRLTGYTEIDDLVNTLPRYRIPGVA